MMINVEDENFCIACKVIQTHFANKIIHNYHFINYGKLAQQYHIVSFTFAPSIHNMHSQLESLPYFSQALLYGPVAILALLALIQLFYFLFVQLRLAMYKSTFTASTKPPVSVIVCARNEFDNLEKHLPSLLNQDYPKYQVVVVNDCSWDNSAKYLEQMATLHSHLKIVTIKEQEKYRHGKKFALTLGIKAAEHETLLLTDADCTPASTNWITETMACYQHDTNAVLGYGAYEKKPGFLNALIRFDTAANASLFLSQAIRGKAYMGVGRNLSYHKKIFFDNKGFANHQHLLSGDDDLFINDISSQSKIEVCVNPDAFTYSVPKQTFGAWFTQKVRHVSTSKSYKTRDQRFLATYHLTHILFWLCAIVLLAFQYQWQLVLAIIGLRLLLQWLVVGNCFARLKENNIIWLIPIFDFIFVFIYPFVSLRSRFYKNKTW